MVVAAQGGALGAGKATALAAEWNCSAQLEQLQEQVMGGAHGPCHGERIQEHVMDGAHGERCLQSLWYSIGLAAWVLKACKARTIAQRERRGTFNSQACQGKSPHIRLDLF